MIDQNDRQFLFNHIPMAVSLSRESDGLYVDVNAEWSRLTGLSVQQVLGRTSLDVGMWDSAEQRAESLAGLQDAGELRNLRMRLARPDQTQLMLEVNVTRLELRGEHYLLSYLKDITGERTAQAAVRISEQMLRATNLRLNQQLRLFEAMEGLASVGYWTSCDAPATLVWSKGLYQLAGLPLGSVKCRTDGRSRIHPDDLPAYVLARQALTGQTLEYRWLHPDGRVHWHRTRIQRLTDGQQGDSDLVFGVVQDITSERETALALQDKLGFIQKITSRLPGVVFQTRSKTNEAQEFLYISEPASQIYPGFTAQEILQDAYCTLCLHHPDDVDAFRASVRLAVSTLTPWQHEYRLRLPDGEVRWLLGHGVPEADGDGAVLMNGFVTDITERKSSEERLRQGEARFRALTELSSDWYWQQNERFEFIQVTGNLAAVNVLPAEQYSRKTRWDSGALGVSQAQWASHRAMLTAHEVFHDFEMQRVRADGTLMWASISGTPMFDAGGKFIGYQGIGRDITERKLAEEKIEQLAFYDALTGLPNRRLLTERLQLALLGTSRHESYGAVLFIDLDNFKDLNDTQGHDMGDLLLRQVAARLQGSVREVDTVARLGGDEFVVVLQEMGHDVDDVTTRVEQVGHKILAKLNQVYTLGKLEHHSTPSVGVALLSRQVKSVDELLKRADLAMYESKAAGRNTMRFFDPAMQALVAQRSAVDRDLRLALTRDELVLYYQPVVDSQAMAVGVEALVRWQHPTLGFLPPSQFIAQAEHTGLIVPLGEWVLRTACEQLVRWANQPDTARLTMAVNVSVRQFRHPDFVAQVLTLLDRTGADPRLLKLEITESLLVTDMQDAIEKMQALRAAHVSFSLDDFGTGYSSLSYLKRLPLDQLKIDQSFVRDVLTDASDAAIANTVLALGQSLNLRVVAEGVEEMGQHDFLLRNGCTYFQGYLFGKPVPIEQLRLGCLAPPLG